MKMRVKPIGRLDAGCEPVETERESTWARLMARAPSEI